MKLLEKLRDQGFHSSIMANFSCDLPFYESLVQARLRSMGCLNNIFLVDAHTYSRSIPTLGHLAARAGRLYLVIPVPTEGAFHPKVFLQVGKKKGRLLLGSANVSTGGFGSNRELVAEIVCNDEASPEQSLIAQAYDYLLEFMDQKVHSVVYKLKRLAADTPWLTKAQRAKGLISLGDDMQVALMFTPGKSMISILNGFVGDERIRRLVVLAPFWDSKLRALSELIEVLDPESTVLLIQPETVSFPSGALAQLGRKVDINDVCWPEERYLHAKLIVAEGEQFDHILTGSANCSVAALGLRDVPAVNAEACLYYRVPSGTAVEALGIAEKLSPEAALKAEVVEKLSLDDDTPSVGGLPHPGHIEAIGRRILWWPSSKIPVEGASVELLDAGLASIGETLAIEKPDLPAITEPFSTPSGEERFARISYDDGNTTAPVILHVHQELRRSAPGAAGARLHDLLERVRLGESAFLDLLDPFERLLFNMPPPKPRSGSKGGAGRAPPEPSGNGKEQIKKLPYNEFLEGRKHPAKGAHNLILTARTDLALLVDSLTKYYDRVDEDSPYTTSDDDIDEDTGEEIELEITPPKPPPPERLPDRDLKRTRFRIRKLVDRFLEWSKKIQKDSNTVTSADDVASLWALVALLGYLCGRPVQLDDGKLERIMSIDDPESDLDFTDTINRVLGNFFLVGENPLVSRLQVPEIADELPAEYFGAWCASYWSLCVGMNFSVLTGHIEMQQDIEALGYVVYRKTGLTEGKLDKDAVLKRLSRIHDLVDLGIEMPPTCLENWHSWFLCITRDECAPAGWAPSMNTSRKCNFQMGDRVWAHQVGPRYVRKVEGSKIFLNKPGGFGECERDNFYIVNAGFVADIEPVHFPAGVIDLKVE